MLAGYLLSSFAYARAAFVGVPLGNKKPLACEGVVRDDPKIKPWGVRFVFDLTACDGMSKGAPLGAVLVSAGAKWVDETLSSGDVVRVPLLVRAPREFRNPGSFSYTRYLMIQGVGAQASARGRLEKVGSRAGPFVSFASAWRRRLKRAIRASVDGEPQAVLTALATGDRSSLSPETREQFSRAGISHLLAISGMHVGYVLVLVFFLLRWMFRAWPSLIERFPISKLAAGFSLPIVWLYIVFVGYPLSAIRAGLMLTVYLAGVVLGLRQDGPTSLAAAVIAVLIVMPLSVLDISFQLSVAAVAGILLLGNPLGQRMRRRERPGLSARFLASVGALLAISIAAAAFTAPLVAHGFGVVTALGPVVNLLAVPLMAGAIMPLVLTASVLTLAYPPLSPFVWRGAGALVQLLMSLAQSVQDWGAPFSGNWFPSSTEVLLAYAGLALVMLGFRAWRGKALIVTAAFSAAVCIDAMALNVAPLIGGKLSATYFDVGQGDSSLIRFPRGKTMLIDGGGLKGSSIDVGKSVLTPALRRLGVKRIDWIVVTHPHFDHFGGLESVLKAFEVGEMFINGRAPEEEEAALWASLLETARSAGVRITTVAGAPTRIESGGAVASITPSPLLSPKELNDTSLMIGVRYGERRYLFTGDLEAMGEEAALRSGAKIDADVLQVGHHGSRDASSEVFLTAVSPGIAVISVGRDNRYGLPDDQTISRLKAKGVRLFRTDNRGAITITTDGGDLEVETWSE